MKTGGMNDTMPEPYIPDVLRTQLRKLDVKMREARKPVVIAKRCSKFDPYKKCKYCKGIFDSRVEQMYYGFTGEKRQRVYLCEKCHNSSKINRKTVYEKYYHRK